MHADVVAACHSYAGFSPAIPNTVPAAALLPVLLLLLLLLPLPGACTPRKRSRCWPLLLLLLPSSAASAAAAALRGLHFAAISDSECPSWPFSCSLAKLVLPAPAAV
jgi:hypothetical protein